MPVVEMPDGALVDLPDNPSPEQLKQLEQVMGGGASKSSRLVEGAKEVGRVLDTGIRGGLAGGAKAVAELFQGLRDKAQATPTGVSDFTPANILMRMAPGMGAEKEKALLSAMTPEKPQTTAGKYIGSGLEGAVGAMTGSPLRQASKLAVPGLVGGVAAEAAGQATDDNPLARLLGGLAGGSVAGVAQAYKPNAEKLIKQAVHGVEDADWRHARALETTLNQMGMPHLKSQLLGPNSSLDDVVKDASANQFVRPEILKATRNIPEKAQKNMELWKNKNLPIQADERRDFLADLQRKAVGKEIELKEAGNQAYKDALPVAIDLESYSPEFIGKLRSGILRLADDSTQGFGPNTDGGRFLKRFVESKLNLAPGGVKGTNASQATTSVAPVDALLRPVPQGGRDALMNAPQPAIPGRISITARTPKDPTQLDPLMMEKAPEGMPKMEMNNLIKELNQYAEQEGYKGLGLTRLKSLLKAATEEDFGAARQARADHMAQNLEPMQQGLAGDIARMKGGPQNNRSTTSDSIISNVFPTSREQQGAIKKLAEDVGGEQVGLLLREHMDKVMNGLKAEEHAPAKLVEGLIGTPAQAKNVEAALMETSKAMGVNPYAVRNGFYDIMKAFKSYGDLKLSPNIDKAALQQAAGDSVIAKVIAPMSRTARYATDQVMRRTYQQISDLVTSPDGLRKLEEIAKRRDPSYTSAVIKEMVATAQAGEEK